MNILNKLGNFDNIVEMSLSWLADLKNSILKYIFDRLFWRNYSNKLFFTSSN